MDSKIVLNIEPFANVTSYLMALIIIHKLYCKRTSNYSLIQKVIQFFLKQLSLSETTVFVDLVNTYKHQQNHPFALIINTIPFIESINNFCQINNIPSLVIEPNVSQCCYCKIKSEFWFKYNCPPMCKDAIMYGVNKIGIIFYSIFFILINTYV